MAHSNNMTKKGDALCLTGAGGPDTVSGSLRRISRGYTVYPAQSAARSELVEFFKVAYSGEFNSAGYRDGNKIAEKWEWGNTRNPNRSGFRSTSWICRENNSGRIVGHFGIMPVSLRYKGAYYSAVWGRDLIVLPQFRKLGVGPLLTAFVLNEVRNEAAIFMIAGLNDQVYKMYNKFGFADMGHIPLYVRINRLEPVIRSRMGSTVLAPLLSVFGSILLKVFYASLRVFGNDRRKAHAVCVDEVAFFDDSFNELWEKASASFNIIVRRDSAALNWRFVGQPYWTYKIFKASRKDKKEPSGYVVVREGHSRGLRTGVIADIFASGNEPDVIRALVDTAVSYFEKKEDIAIIRCDVLDKTVQRVLKKSGFILIPSDTRFMFTNIREDLDPNHFKDRNSWFVDYADSDLDLSGRMSA